MCLLGHPRCHGDQMSNTMVHFKKHSQKKQKKKSELGIEPYGVNPAIVICMLSGLLFFFFFFFLTCP